MDRALGYSFFVDQINFCVKSGVECINDDDVIVFCLYPMNKMRRNLSKIRSRAILRSTSRLDRFSNYFKDDGGFAFCLFDKKTKKSIYWFIHGVEGISANSPVT